MITIIIVTTNVNNI